MARFPMRRVAPRYVTVHRRVERLLKLLKGHDEVVILTHNDPDPDGVSASWALSHLLRRVAGIRATILYGGMIGRAENRAMVELLQIPLQPADSAKFDPAKPVLLVDTQLGTRNHALPPGTIPLAVMDHHPMLPDTSQVPYHDVQSQFGATATLLTRYLWALSVEPSPQLATALFYGIRTDTLGLSRGASRADGLAYLYLHERADLRAVGAIEHAQLSKDYFVVVSRALHAARIYRDVVVSVLGRLQHPDMSAEVADLLLRLQGARWALCVGHQNKTLILSLRTQEADLNAGQVIQELVGRSGHAGGHTEMAGGRVPFEGSSKAAEAELVARFLKLMKLSDVQPENLLSR